MRNYFVFCVAFSFLLNVAGQQKALNFEDVMKFRQIKNSGISEDGSWVYYSAAPDRGDSDVYVVSSDGKVKHRVELAGSPRMSKDGKWVAMKKENSLEEKLRSEKNEDKKLAKEGMVLLNTGSGEKFEMDSVKSFLFSNDNKWLVYQSWPKEEKAKTGSDLRLKSLVNDEEVVFDFVTDFVLDSAANYLAYVVSDTSKENNGLYVTPLLEAGLELAVKIDSMLWVDQMTWNTKTGMLAFVSGLKDVEGRKGPAKVYGYSSELAVSSEQFESDWKQKLRVLVEDADLDEGWCVYHKNSLRWSKDGERLFVGVKPFKEFEAGYEDADSGQWVVSPSFPDATEGEKWAMESSSLANDSVVELYDFENILEKREVDVWHWDDSYINSEQKKRWKNEEHRTYAGVYFVGDDKFVRLADEEMQSVRLTESKKWLMGSSNAPYAKMTTWDGWYSDYYLVDMNTGKRKMIIAEQGGSVHMSPDGKYTVFYRDAQWYLVNNGSLAIGCLTCNLEEPFADEDWDYPADVPGYYGVSWVGESEAVVLYDKYDVWQFSTKEPEAICLTNGIGRKNKIQFRIRDLDGEKAYFDEKEEVYLSAYFDLKKKTELWQMTMGKVGVKELSGGSFRIHLKEKAKEADKLLFTKESYEIYPDLYVAGMDLKKAVKLTDFGSQTEDYAWGKSELVEWSSMDGTPLQGILIKPGNYVEGKRYPVLVYYYRFFTPRMYNFPGMVVNHRPNYPLYASNDYAIFLPDIRFDIGTPGYAATKCLVPGVQKIIDMGVADADAIALHGHSWSGYQTAFVITQTNMFACAIAGAPVSNMTSAYSGIRWGSGMARQFQYEKSQSRIGASMWEARDKYIENSPVFFADRIETPLLIEFGDKDEAVPWYQGIELYLAMRRLEKECVFLQYRGEPHHLKKYANKLDYSIRFKEYMDHYLKGVEAAEWILEGVAYDGK